jgi:hypothetical protein
VDLEPAEAPAPSRVVLLVEFTDGAARTFTANQPCDYVMAVTESSHPGEPRITVTFAGNPAAGGMHVSQRAGWPLYQATTLFPVTS